MEACKKVKTLRVSEKTIATASFNTLSPNTSACRFTSTFKSLKHLLNNRSWSGGSLMIN